MSEEKEVLAYAITHAPPGVKGGPYEADDEGTWGTASESLRPGHAVRWRTRPTQERIDTVLRHVREVHPHARVIRIVRKARPSEASAVEVLRELVRVGTTLAGKTPLPKEDIRVSLECFADEVRDVRTALARARRILATHGPDPSEVVRDLVMLLAGELDYDLAKSLDPKTAEEPQEAERNMRGAVKRVAEQFVVARKADGK